MKTIIEHYGLGLLEILVTLRVIAIIFGCVGEDGVVSKIIAEYMLTICG